MDTVYDDIDSTGVEIVIALRGPCNYNCHYCVTHHEIEKQNLFKLDQLRTMYASIDCFTVTSFECGASEPTLHPQIKELISLAASYGAVSIPTNNSIPPERWLPEPVAHNVLVRAALHPQGEQNLELFIQNLLTAKKMGAHVRCIYVAHPSRLDKVDEYQNRFKKYGIPITLVAFTGEYQGHIYPQSYTTSERDFLGLDTQNWYARLSSEIICREFYGIPCLAGYQSLYIGKDGELHRCENDKSILDEPYDMPMPCRVKWCDCGLLLEELNTLSHEHWSSWRKLCGHTIRTNPKENKDRDYDVLRLKYIELMCRYNPGRIKAIELMCKHTNLDYNTLLICGSSGNDVRNMVRFMQLNHMKSK
ncbi:MAG: hypothetical protein M0T70_16460 [Geobacteraceae bacterium]|nr:hypothetical protein [Geobacteraceae bacterium]